MLAKQYAQQMIDDDKRDGNDAGASNFQVIADQKDEQDYAINVYKGSGNMGEIFHEKKSQTAAPKKVEKKIEKAPEKTIEELVDGGAAAMYEFSNAVANSAL